MNRSRRDVTQRRSSVFTISRAIRRFYDRAASTMRRWIRRWCCAIFANTQRDIGRSGPDSHLFNRMAWRSSVPGVRELYTMEAGCYRCNVVIVSVPPDILDDSTSTDMEVQEGSNVTLRCAATGTPKPKVTWRREIGGTIAQSNSHEGTYLRGK